MRTPKGHIRRRGGSYEISVPVGRDPVTKRYRYAYDYATDEETAERKRAELIARVAQGREPTNRATVNDLLNRWLSVAELETRVGVLDVLYAELRRCRRLCGGRKGLVDHRPLGRGRRDADGEPRHECDERCRPHQCRPLGASSIAQIHLQGVPSTSGDCGVPLSLGRTGQCWDNALSESFFASIKGELLDLLAGSAQDTARRAIVAYIPWYNGARLHSTLGERGPRIRRKATRSRG